ncbi:heme oxygenase 1 [Malaya genurostris]|uniref:heme oxygenase 1 n=1 Tax=Malaya genurostris TaxID=325434 RepID=UPI0026F398F5|nr:heme oxygenase 1 [Malaya genurostris]
MDSKKLSFSKEMRLATRDIHSVSDGLVNAKLAFALYDNAVWAEGLIIFYEIFKFLEQHVANDFLPDEFHRTQQFEQDLNTYLGSDWRNSYHPRKEVLDYIKHLEELERQNPNLLVAYVYHLYMGLLSGGQILQKRKNMSKKFNFFASKTTSTEGAAITTFEDNSIYELKQKMRKIVDDFGDRLDEDTRQQLVAESRKVFELNNCVIRTVSGVNKANVRVLMYVGIVIIGIAAVRMIW